MSKPSVYKYVELLQFLSDWLAFKKASQSNYSLRVFASECNLAPSYISMLLSGKRKVSSADTLEKLILGLKLKDREIEFFRLLVELHKTKSQDRRTEILNEMSKFKHFKLMNKQEALVHNYLSKWYHVAIREMSALPDFRLDPKWVQKKLQHPVPLAEIRQAMDFLIQNDFIKLSHDGTKVSPSDYLDCHGGVYKIALTEFHRQMFEVTAKSIDSVPSKDRNILGQTFALNADHLKEAKEILNEAYDRIQKLYKNKKSGDTVFHVVLGISPLTRIIEDENN